MKSAPYSLREAEQLCAEYQYLVGLPFAKQHDAIIEHVTISPFDETSKKRFLIFYFLTNNAEMALANDYKGLLFDVLVIARSATDQHEVVQEDIFTWLANNSNISYGEQMPARQASGS